MAAKNIHAVLNSCPKLNSLRGAFSHNGSKKRVSRNKIDLVSKEKVGKGLQEGSQRQS